MSTSPELQDMTAKELYALAKAHDIAGRSRMRKGQLIDALEMSESYQQTLAPVKTTPVCPACDSAQIWIGHDPGFAMGGCWIQGGPFVRCETCGKTTAGEPKRVEVPAEPPAEVPAEPDAVELPALTRERAEELVLAAEAANDWWDATNAEILNEIVPANVTADSIDTATRPDVAAAYRIVIGADDPTPADEGGEVAGGPAYVYCRCCSLESVSAGVPYCADCADCLPTEYTVTVPKQYDNAPDESEITIGITALGGGTVGRAYAGTGWQWQVRENSTLVLLAQDLRSNMTPATHDDMARTLAAFLSADAETLAYGDRDALSTEYTQAQRDFIESNGERLSAFAHDPFNE